MNGETGRPDMRTGMSSPAGVRREGLDTLRGAALASMLAYHACWDLVWIFGVDWPWYRSFGAFVWQQSICWTFILLSGFCFPLGRYSLRRGSLVFFCGYLITAVTVLWLPANRVFFGILSLLGSAVLLTAALEEFLRRVPAAAGLSVSFLFFLLTRGINGGTVCFGQLRLPAFLYRNDLTACLGFPPAGFFSTDYFPLLPWLFLFWSGYYLYALDRKRTEQNWKTTHGLGISGAWQWKIRLPLLTAMGRHSLLIYLLHQPVLYGLLTLCFRFLSIL